MTRCPSCGNTYEVASGFCPIDGAALKDLSPPPELSGRVVGGAAAWVPALPSVEETQDASGGRGEVDGFDHDGEELLLGRTLSERYRMDDHIGAGGMGLVYKAVHLSIDKPVAVKVLRAQYAEVEEVAKRFALEANIASKIRHPNVVDISDYGQTPKGSPYYVMELLEGTSLADLIDKGGKVELARAINIAIQLASGLGAAHQLGVVHRDLKPDNVILVPGPVGEVAKILDFGIARVTGRNTRLTAAGSVVGTPEYMSPEQAQGKEVDARSDIYSVGVILFEMLAAQVPIRGATMVETLTKQVYDPAPKLSEVDASFAGPEFSALVALLESLLSKDANQRPQDSAALVHQLRVLLSPQASSAENNTGFKATVAMGSWSVGDMPQTVPAPNPASERSGPQFSQGAPPVGFAVPNPMVGAMNLKAPVQVAAAAPIAAPGAAAPGGPAVARQMMPGFDPGAVQPMQVPAAVPMQVPPGYTRRPTSSLRRRNPTQWGLVIVVGVLGSFGAGLGVVALFEYFGGPAQSNPAALPATSDSNTVMEQASADAIPALPPAAEQSGVQTLAPLTDTGLAATPGDEAVGGGDGEIDPPGANGAKLGAAEAPSVEPAQSAAKSPAESKKKSTKKAKKSTKKPPLEATPLPTKDVADSATPDVPPKPPEAGSDTDPPPDPGVSLGDLRDPFG